MASLQSNSTFSFKHHLTGEAWPACRAILPFQCAHPANCIRCSSNIAIADHFPSKTFSFKHHLTGEALPACRAILPFHSNTTRQARHGSSCAPLDSALAMDPPAALAIDPPGVVEFHGMEIMEIISLNFALNGDR